MDEHARKGEDRSAGQPPPRRHAADDDSRGDDRLLELNPHKSNLRFLLEDLATTILLGVPVNSFEMAGQDLDAGQRSRWRFWLADLIAAVLIAGAAVGVAVRLAAWLGPAVPVPWFVPATVIGFQIPAFFLALGYLARRKVRKPWRRTIGFAALQFLAAALGFLLALPFLFMM